MATATETHEALAVKLVRSAYTHGRIFSNHRLHEWKMLLDHEDTPLVDVLAELAAIPERRFEGHVDLGDKTVTTFTVVTVIANMVSVHVHRTISFICSKLAAFNNNAKEVYNQFNKSKGSLEDALRLLAALQTLDRRWRCVLKRHITNIRQSAQSLVDRLSTRDKKDLGIRSDLLKTILGWENTR